MTIFEELKLVKFSIVQPLNFSELMVMLSVYSAIKSLRGTMRIGELRWYRVQTSLDFKGVLFLIGG